MRFRPFSTGSGLPNLGEPRTYADCHCDTHAQGNSKSEAASQPAASPDTVSHKTRRSISVKYYMSAKIVLTQARSFGTERIEFAEIMDNERSAPLIRVV